MSTRTEALTEEFNLWLDRYSPRRALQQNEKALEAEVTALMRVVFKMAPASDYLHWLEKVTAQLDYQMKTSAWPTVSEVGSACSNINKEGALSSPPAKRELDPITTNAARMNAGEAVSDGCLYGRMAVAILKSGEVTSDTMRKYRSAFYFNLKDIHGEDSARQREAYYLARHEAAERLDTDAGDIPQGEPFKRMPTHENDEYANAVGL